VAEHDLGRLAAFVENRLDATERSAVLSHLADCRDCRDVVASLARNRTDFQMLTATDRGPVLTRVWLPIAAAAILVVGAGWLYMYRASQEGTTIEPVTRGNAEREVAGQRFRLEAGTWVDVSYDPFKLLPAVDVRSTAERDALLTRVPALRPFLSLGPKVTVVHAGTVYRFDLPR
jgi:hypothetical protein